MASRELKSGTVVTKGLVIFKQVDSLNPADYDSIIIGERSVVVMRTVNGLKTRHTIPIENVSEVVENLGPSVVAAVSPEQPADTAQATTNATGAGKPGTPPSEGGRGTDKSSGAVKTVGLRRRGRPRKVVAVGDRKGATRG